LCAFLQIHPHLWDRLGDMYENECIYDRLGCAVSPNGQHIAAGAYGELAVFDAFDDKFSLLKTCVQPFTQNVRGLPQLFFATAQFYIIVFKLLHCSRLSLHNQSHTLCLKVSEKFGSQVTYPPFTTINGMQGVSMRAEPFPVSHKWKVENVAWHPNRHLIVATSLNSLFTFCARKPPGI
jgi:hypothetical protein